jgi:hypothetical protein
MDYLMKHGSDLRNQHHIHATNIEAIALASVVCDDSVEPVRPDDASRVLCRKEVLRLTDAEVREKYPGYGGSLAMMESEKFISRENAVRIEDLSGNAAYMGKKDHQGAKELPTGYDGMEVTVKQFSDHELASHVILNVTNYMGYGAGG